MPFQHLSVDQLKEMMAAGDITVVDIRDPQSYAGGHIEGAVQLDDSTIEAFVSSHDKSAPVVVCCYHGNSSQGAAEFLSERGFTQAYSLDGGYAAWGSSAQGG